MAEELSWKQEGATLHLTGELDGETVQSLWQVREKAVAGVTSFELSGLTRVDTAGLALLIHLINIAGRKGAEVRLQGASENLRTLAQLYNLPDKLLPHLAG
ncbi:MULTISPECIES: lipid asymmetry maintenance protein MlaB [Cedecea]|uniref:STAS domain protein n=1 Tax=Cedecea davisae DSM 4568 TaxID=566551 RepID=S3IJD8_9ENTR|nr:MULTISPECIES: lipid asymmetry maintenance protein MlaB [Cedecea]EPF13983.1 STAS domain protein [Cedecea davisae DSM 4568]QIX96206.1 lipid asymmetry maintenance protein MlaB [Cedecea sp. FDAARGOS_727]SUX37541.1 Probable phospholipid ABC transporter-binding protein mlaB [Cedecea davisae]